MDNKVKNLVGGAMIALAVMGASKDVSAQDNMVNSRTTYNVQTGKFAEKIEALYNNGSAYLAVTSPLSNEIKDPANTVVEFSMATKSNTAENKIEKHLLPQNAYVTANADGSGFGVGAQWCTPKVGNEKFGIKGNAWVVYYPKLIGGEKDMAFVQVNVKPDVKKSKDDGALSFVAKAIVPDNIKTNITKVLTDGEQGKAEFAGLELLWSEKPLKDKIAETGKVGKIASKVIPDNVLGSVDKKGKLKNVGGDYQVGF